ncbi:MAG: TIGR02996 domain-containing protein [Mariniblastus sp.]
MSEQSTEQETNPDGESASGSRKIRPSNYNPVEVPFILDISKYPNDADYRKIYADWLEESGDPLRANILRIQCEMSRFARENHFYQDLLEERTELVDALKQNYDQAEVWLALIGHAAIEKCSTAAAGDDCPKRWENLPASDNAHSVAADTIRACTACRKLVRYCYSVSEALSHIANGECVSIDPGVARKRYDLTRFVGDTR